MSTNFDDVGDFHEKFDLPHVREGWIVDKGKDPGPRELSHELIEFRIDFMKEELQEFLLGWLEDDHAQMADALVDLVYVAMGTAHLLGYPWQELWNEVQRANMTKQRAAKDGSDSKRGSSWDVVKPEGWKAPDIEGILARWGF